MVGEGMFLARLRGLLTVMEFDGAIQAILTWPKFSLASFLIVSRLKRAGISPKLVVDIGANVGQFAVAATRLFNGVRVLSIEPDSRTADVLRHNLRAEKQTEVLVSAIGDYVGDARFHVNKDTQVSSLLELGRDRIRAFPRSTVVEEITVKVTTLDVLFHERRVEGPILVKIDVQGFEDKVIRGGSNFLCGVDWVLVEVSFADLYDGEQDFSSISNLLDELGFKFLRPMNFHISPLTGEVMEMDALYCRRRKGKSENED
ncbi:MAG: FkbM family methyltransferase [Betaproteobacteria bacterium]|nr:MAG: FkbM family methyltransferase [Betaproteobacteria bacterium]